MQCQNHADAAAIGTCTGCAEPFCASCLVSARGATYCAGCKSMAVSKVAPHTVAICSDAKTALGIAFVAIIFCGPIFGPLAIAKAASARRQIAANPALGGKGWADAATVVGSVSLFTFLIFLMQSIRGMG